MWLSMKKTWWTLEFPNIISDLSKFVGCKKYLLATKKSEIDISKLVFIISIKTFGLLRHKSHKNMHDLFTKNCKTLLREISSNRSK